MNKGTVISIHHQDGESSYRYLDKYDEVDLVLFASLDNFEFPINGFAYDNITDQDIEKCLSDSTNLSSIDTKKEWQDDDFLANSKDIKDELKHAYRVAKIVQEIMNGTFIMNPVHFDTFIMDSCMSGISDGHHRIRALKYLEYVSVPVLMNGDLDIISSIIKIKEQ